MGFWNWLCNRDYESVATKTLETTEEKLNRIQLALEKVQKVYDQAAEQAEAKFLEDCKPFPVPSSTYRIIKYDNTLDALLYRNQPEWIKRSGYYIQKWHLNAYCYRINKPQYLCDLEDFSPSVFGFYRGVIDDFSFDEEKVEAAIREIGDSLKVIIETAKPRLEWVGVSPDTAHLTHAAAQKWLKAWLNPETRLTHYDERGKQMEDTYDAT